MCDPKSHDHVKVARRAIHASESEKASRVKGPSFTSILKHVSDRLPEWDWSLFPKYSILNCIISTTIQSPSIYAWPQFWIDLKLSATGFYHFTEKGQLWKLDPDWDPVSSSGSFWESEGLPVWGCVLAPPHCRTRWRSIRASEVIPWLQLGHLGVGKLKAVLFWMNTKKQSGNLAEMSWLSKASNTSGKCG